MFCVKCGKEVKEGTKFCTNCGAEIKETKKEEVKDDKLTYSQNKAIETTSNPTPVVEKTTYKSLLIRYVILMPILVTFLVYLVTSDMGYILSELITAINETGAYGYLAITVYLMALVIGIFSVFYKILVNKFSKD